MFDEISTDIREGEVQSLYKRFAAFDRQGEARMRKASFRKSCFFRVTLKDRNTFINTRGVGIGLRDNALTFPPPVTVVCVSLTSPTSTYLVLE